ncbi:MAG: helix-turn-helix transcriptional regulator [Bacteroidales bacterium]|nr:helix-turn-helix transcriptional regulator [Bacteroidales bacterium]
MDIITQKPWAISDRKINVFCTKNLEKKLSLFNLACSGEYYIVDWFFQKFIVGSPNAMILCGHPKNVLEKDGFSFFNRILKKNEHYWLNQINTAAYDIFFRYPISQRTKFIAIYDMVVTTTIGEELILHHKIVPYELCKNGNLWLMLCHVTVSSSKNKKYTASFTNTETGNRYTFIKNKFVSCDSPSVTEEDMYILKQMIKGLPDKQICLLLNISLSSFKSKKRCFFEKLDVRTSASAVHKAHLLGLI